jgi:hypothetical protein
VRLARRPTEWPSRSRQGHRGDPSAVAALVTAHVVLEPGAFQPTMDTPGKRQERKGLSGHPPSLFPGVSDHGRGESQHPGRMHCRALALPSDPEPPRPPTPVPSPQHTDAKSAAASSPGQLPPRFAVPAAEPIDRCRVEASRGHPPPLTRAASGPPTPGISPTPSYCQPPPAPAGCAEAVASV